MKYPEQRHVLDATTIRRERLLPEDALGNVTVEIGERVDLNTVVARGTVPSRYVVLDAIEFFRLKNPDALVELLFVEAGDLVDAGQPLAGKSPRKGKRLLSPVTGIVALIDAGRIIVQETPEVIDLSAGLNGEVLRRMPGRGVVVEAAATLVQGVWGNGRRVIGLVRVEPDEGLEAIQSDGLEMRYRGTIIVTRRPLRATGLDVMTTQGLSGVIAPSMSPALCDAVMDVKSTIMLTEGFGDLRMSTAVFNLLKEHEGQQGTLDAAWPVRWQSRRPELIINAAINRTRRPPPPATNLICEAGLEVRLTREPYAGQMGRVVDLHKTPCLLDNGFKVSCVRVELVTGKTVIVPFANIEVLGR